MIIFTVFLQKLEPSWQLERSLLAFLGRLSMENGRHWCFFSYSTVRYLQMSCQQGGVESQYWRSIRVH